MAPTSRTGGVDGRAAGIEAFRYPSARDPDGGTNLALFTVRLFTMKRPRELETWRSVSSRGGVEFAKRDYFERRHVRFARDVFLVDGTLPNPSLQPTSPPSLAAGPD